MNGCSGLSTQDTVTVMVATEPDVLRLPDAIRASPFYTEEHEAFRATVRRFLLTLVREGYVASVRGRFGGVKLAREPVDINVGAVVRHTEEGFDLADCGSCLIAPACGLTGALHQALAAFLAVLDGYTLEDLLAKRLDMRALFAEREPA